MGASYLDPLKPLKFILLCIAPQKCIGGNKMKCKDCNGQGLVQCENCSGEGIDFGIHKCEECSGEGMIPCSSCQGKGKTSLFKRRKTS